MIPRRPDDLRRAVTKALDKNDLDRALAAIRDAMWVAWRSSLRRGSLNVGSAKLDALCELVGRKVVGPAETEMAGGPDVADPLDIYIGSELYQTGGHTALIGDYLQNAGSRRALLVVTNIENRHPAISPGVLTRLGIDDSQIAICPERNLCRKLVWLTNLLARRQPARVFLFNHPHDSVAIAACQPSSRTRFYFVHHADRMPTLGAFTPLATHIDVTPFRFHSCRRNSSFADNLFIPLVAHDLGCRDFARPRAAFKGLTTASSGSPDKFRLDYTPGYIDVIAAVLRATGGRHIHIGQLPRRHLNRFRSALERHGVARDRLLHIPFVPSVWQAMSDLEIDLYIGSFPVPGARTSIEVMGSGTPAVWHVRSEVSRFQDTHMKYPEAESWETAAEFLDLIHRIDASWLKRQSKAARRHYEQKHHPGILASALSRSMFEGVPAPYAEPVVEEPGIARFDASSVSGIDRGLVFARTLRRLCREWIPRWPSL
jgi:hypothetical protein